MLGQRYATFKMYYTDETPDEYEPPLFSPGDAEKDKFTFGTHSISEEPESLNIGTGDAGYHS